MNEQQCIIYALKDPETLEIRYIGQTSRGMRRPQEHEIFAKKIGAQSYKYKWIRALQARGFRYLVEILQVVESAELLNEAECAWIEKGRKLGWKLTNLTDGGEGTRGYREKKSPEHRMKISAANKGRIISVSARQKQSATLKGRKLTEEHKQALRSAKRPPRSIKACKALSRALLGHCVTAETKNKISVKALQRALTEKGQADLARARALIIRRKGFTFSEETRRKMSLAAKKRAATPEGHARLCAASAARKHS